jgi:hypothetical protein
VVLNGFDWILKIVFYNYNELMGYLFILSVFIHNTNRFVIKTKLTCALLSGEPAYIMYWLKFYEYKVTLSTVMALDTNLEIIVDDTGELLAYRHDCPGELSGMVKSDGEWSYWKHSKE